MAIAQYAAFNAVTVGATELSLISGTSSLSTDTTDGVYQVFIDTTNLAKADEFLFRAYETALSGGTKREFMRQSLLGAQSGLWVSPSFILMHGWDFTLQKIAGTDRAITASVRQIA